MSEVSEVSEVSAVGLFQKIVEVVKLESQWKASPDNHEKEEGFLVTMEKKLRDLQATLAVADLKGDEGDRRALEYLWRCLSRVLQDVVGRTGRGERRLCLSLVECLACLVRRLEGPGWVGGSLQLKAEDITAPLASLSLLFESLRRQVARDGQWEALVESLLALLPSALQVTQTRLTASHYPSLLPPLLLTSLTLLTDSLAPPPHSSSSSSTVSGRRRLSPSCLCGSLALVSASLAVFPSSTFWRQSSPGIFSALFNCSKGLAALDR